MFILYESNEGVYIVSIYFSFMLKNTFPYSNKLKINLHTRLDDGKDPKYEIDDKTKNEIKDKIKKEIEDEIDCKRDKNGHDKGDKDKDGFNKDGYDKDGYNEKGFYEDGKKKGDNDDGSEVTKTAFILS
ncbi:hypothetical protein JSQ73_005885 [Wolbachia endosymbiont of Anopheles demeilloni]|uniref:hypothetical protein n=1 Tax=Wolbachia endosymbiont of Anopheles demeilloni TaxID=2748871 RepID=UPI001BDAE94A|nr:hypothetical protein [Wolbachia endosymbiont of Anopheles demeilloni]UIP92663.1 hypothetical protein JSQ73_005885 [Wolbachia endosymbiont of Anopheles demeilloni]